MYEIECSSEQKRWVVHKRYSQLLDLHERVIKLYGEIDLKKFPPKFLVGNFEKKKMDWRMEQLNEYLEDLISRNIPEVTQFFKSGTEYRNSWKVGNVQLENDV